MAHEIEIVEGRASMFYVMERDSDVPWHGLGTSVAEAPTWAEAIQLANLDREVELRSIYDAHGVEIPGFRAVTRKDDAKTFAVSGENYVPIQAREVGDFLDSLVQDRKLVYETAMSLYDGARIVVLARFPKDVKIAGDVWAEYLLASTTHDLTESMKLWAVKIRVVCANTFKAARSGQKSLVSIRHSGDVQAKMEQARITLNVTTEEQKRMTDLLKLLAKHKTQREYAVTVRDALLGPLDSATPAQRRTAIEVFNDIYFEERDLTGENGYTLFNTVTGYADHGLKTRKDTNRMASVLNGRAAQVKADGLAAIASVTGIAI